MNENKSEGQDEIQTKPLCGAADETLLCVGSGKWNFKDNILYYGKKRIAELQKEVDGFYVLPRNGMSSGCYSGHILKEIGECIELINKPWSDKMNEEFKELNARSGT